MDTCESCERAGPTMALTLPALAEAPAEVFNVCGYCMADALAWARREA